MVQQSKVELLLELKNRISTGITKAKEARYCHPFFKLLIVSFLFFIYSFLLICYIQKEVLEKH